MVNRVDGALTTFAYSNIVVELNAKLKKNMNKEYIKNRWKVLKVKFAKCYEILREGPCKFSYDPMQIRGMLSPKFGSK